MIAGLFLISIFAFMVLIAWMDDDSHLR